MYGDISALALSEVLQLKNELEMERAQRLNNKVLREAAKADRIATYGNTPERLLALEKASQGQEAAVQALARQYKEDIEKAKTDPSAQTKLDKTTESLATALPGMTKGTLNAIQAFQEGDAISGSAAVMDIFASLAPFLGGLATAGGPPGMLVGALFSMVGEILRFFAPKPKPLAQEIREALADLQADDAEMNILAFRDNVTIQVNSLNKGMSVYRDILEGLRAGQVDLALELTRNAAPKAGGEEVKIAGNIDVVRKLVESFNPVTMDLYWKTYAWLSKPKRQDHELWPVVLDLWCRTYIDLLTSVIQIATLTNERDEQAWIAYAPETQKKKVRASYDKLWSSGQARLLQFEAANTLMLKKLSAIESAAQNRGTSWHGGDSVYSGRSVYIGNNIRTGNFHQLASDTKRVSVAQTGSLNPTYHVVALTPNGDVDHGTVVAPYRSADWKRLSSLQLQGPSDIWTVAGGRPDLPPTRREEFCFYTTKERNVLGYLCSKEGEAVKFYDRRFQVDVTWIRAVHRPDSLPGDPDDAIESVEHKGVMLPGVLDRTRSIVCGGRANYPLIQIDECREEENEFSLRDAVIEAPRGLEYYSGIAVDQKYLWVYGRSSFACATHVSVIRAAERHCTDGNFHAPRWIYPRHPPEFPGFPDDAPERKALVGFSPCEDETLVAAVRWNPYSADLADAEFVPGMDLRRHLMYAAAYRVDIQKGTIDVEKFTQVEGAGTWVQKLPIFCWAEFESLRKTLEKMGRDGPGLSF